MFKIFVNFTMQIYQSKVKQSLLEKKWFSFVEALECFTDTFYYGRNRYSVPNYNVYVPPRQTIMKRPNLGDDRNDELSY